MIASSKRQTYMDLEFQENYKNQETEELGCLWNLVW